MYLRLLVLILSIALGLSGLANPAYALTPLPGFQVETVLSGLNFPIQLAFTPDGRIFFNEKDTGNVRIINNAGVLEPAPFATVTVSNFLERGLLGIALHPDFDNPPGSNKFVYIYYTEAAPLRNRVVRYTDNGGQGVGELVIIDDLPAGVGGMHNGGIIKFGPDGKLYIVIGNAEDSNNSQDLTSLAGKVLRLNPDGTIPSDNPFVGDPTALDEIFAYGIRNSFGLGFHPITGALFETENGPTTDDEINIIVPGGNYGSPIHQCVSGQPGFEDPIICFTPTTAPTGITFYTGTQYPVRFGNGLFFGEFNSGKVRFISLNAPGFDSVNSIEDFVIGFSALIDVTSGLDKNIYVTTVDAIYRIKAIVPEIIVSLQENAGQNLFTVTLSNDGEDTEAELKLWIDSPGLGILGSIVGVPTPVLTIPPALPFEMMSNTPLPGILPFPGTTVGGRLINPITGDILSESICTEVPCN